MLRVAVSSSGFHEIGVSLWVPLGAAGHPGHPRFGTRGFGVVAVADARLGILFW